MEGNICDGLDVTYVSLVALTGKHMFPYATLMDPLCAGE
jgi:hypothetical protein